MINPNDPEENPDAFAPAAAGYGTEGSRHSERTAPPRVSSNKRTSLTTKYNDIPHNREDGIMRQQSGIEKPDLTPGRSGDHRSSKSPSGSEISSSDRSYLRGNNRHMRYNRRSSSNSYSPSPPASLKNGSLNVAEVQHQRVASVPKFGDWDATDPTSGDGFTIIFNKVKQEKEAAGSYKPHTGRPEATLYENGQRNQRCSSSSAKCCWLF
ncbi:hypothetical protein Syun_026894 [Stephania yunnanensis]|uniref:RIN4 pathogenic type III effector avirulence factor Avr cleavage site domain-containing protein n=1 Tax=Stephania yunnanensis TaxID=152371 RepID=A0AAP0EK34_9MAGN